jgi:hypothetical protein
MGKDILQITLKERKEPKTLLGKWWNKHMYWKWVIFWGKVKSKFYGGLSKFMLSLLPKEKREEILKEYEEVEVHIVNETESEEMTQAIKDALESQYGIDYDEEEFKKHLDKEMNKLLNQ